MKRTFTFFLLALSALLVSGCVAVSTSGDYTLERGKTLRGNLLVTSGRIMLEEGSRVTGSVFMTSGTLDVGGNAEIEGDVFMTSGNVSLGRQAKVRGNVIATSGNVRLGPEAVVRGDVITTSGNVTQAEGARVEGKISSDGFDIGASIVGTLCLPPLILLGIFLYWLIDLARRRRVPEAKTGLSPTLVAGVLLILVGAAVLTQNLTDWDLGNWWALLILIPAVSSLAHAWQVIRLEGGLTSAARGPLVSGVAMLLVTGIFLFGLSWSALWPLFLIIVGFGVLIAR